MLKQIKDEICDAIEELFLTASQTNYIAFILLIARAEKQQGLKSKCGTDYVTEYPLDIYFDETRTCYYINYLRKNYSKEGYHYQKESAIEDITTELTIYSHIWDSDYFMKSLYRFAAIIDGQGYLWDNFLPEKNIHEHFIKNVISVFKQRELKIGGILDKCYKSSIRNAFAHSRYFVDTDTRELSIRPKVGFMNYSFEEFQDIFLHAVILMNKMENYQEINHNRAAEKRTAITEPFFTPDGVKVQVYGRMVEHGDTLTPELHIVKVKEQN